MKKLISCWGLILILLIGLSGCGGDSSNSSDAQALIDDNIPDVTGTTSTGGTGPAAGIAK